MSFIRPQHINWPTENMHIEKIRRQDLYDLEGLFTAAFSGEIPPQQLQQRIRRMRQFYYLLLPLSYISAWVRNLSLIYICRIGDKIIGFTQLSHLNNQQLHLDYLAISPNYRGNGMGAKVLEYICTQIADPYQYDLILEVNITNPVDRLYQQFGFTEKIQLVNYEKKMLPPAVTSSTVQYMPGFRKRTDTDWQLVYELYLRCIPLELRQVMKKKSTDFKSGMFTKILAGVKDRLMGNQSSYYVVEQADGLIATLDIYCYPKSHTYTLSIMLDPGYEQLRVALIKQALDLLPYRADATIYTTIYSDNPSKHEVLQKYGFLVKEAYRLMIRQPLTIRSLN